MELYRDARSAEHKMCYDCLRPTRVTTLHFSNGIIHITLIFTYCSYIQRSCLQPRKHRVLDLLKLANIDYWISSGFQHRILGFLKLRDTVDALKYLDLIYFTQIWHWRQS